MNQDRNELPENLDLYLLQPQIQ
uniref:Uncharacterized protein n=1 Tax=Rhizophora mucronata TaxID=61149 RepID=A0A2P2K190_RHIMU